ncbi:hypothetical protein EX30DRAFT_228658 [Ascodesmis nigricans]|uniref:Uncharacterized protein n=1 Tax=Ascodesmis nigricans TaxID=341454 RepID=A0A4S2MNF4_9PEZI|nr:hypothetical protein EX30DRAFT_228658 [Ascodesmis nigricans]
MLQQMTTIQDPALHDMQKKAYTALLEELHPELLIWILQTKYNEDQGRRFTAEEDAILRKQFERDPFRLASLPCETRKLHGRYLDNRMWKRWYDGLPADIDKPQKPPAIPVEIPPVEPEIPELPTEMEKIEAAVDVEGGESIPSESDGKEVKAEPGLEPFMGKKQFFKFLMAQIIGWLPIATCCGFAAAISWTTPRVSFGCRSLNHLLYAYLTFVCAILYALIQYLRFNHSSRRYDYPFAPHPAHSVAPTRTYRIWHPFLNGLYHVLMQLNSFIFLAGTVFQLAGVFRSCFCKIGIEPAILWAFNIPGWKDVPVQWGVDTRLHREMSLTVWVPINMAAWSLVGAACFGGIGAKEWILRKLRRSGKEVVEKEHLDREVWRVDASDDEEDDATEVGDWKDTKQGCVCEDKGGFADEKRRGEASGTCRRCGGESDGGVRVRVFRTSSQMS